MLYKKWLVLLTGLLLCSPAWAQQEVGLHFMPELWQASKTNPAFLANQGSLTIALPGIHNTLFFTGPTYGEVVVEQNGETVLNVDNLIAALEDRNLLRENLEIETLGAYFRMGSVVLGLQHSVKFNAFLNYPKTLPELIWNGNAQYIGETIDLNHNLEINSYNEFALSGALSFNQLNLGARVKLLTGIGDVSTERNDASLFTDDEFYQLTFSADYLLNTSSILDYQSYNDFNAEFNFGRLEGNQLFTSNFGYGLDLGAQLQLERLSLAASVLDIGQINWTENVTNYSAVGDFTYDGLDIAAALTGDSVSLDQALDTIAQIFDFRADSTSYTTTLPTKVYLSGSFDLTDKWTIGALVFSEFYRGELFNTFALSARGEVLNWLSVGVTYAVVQNTYANIGLNTAFKLGPMQLFAATDNVIAAFDPENSRYFNFRAGLNVALNQREED